MVQFYLELMLSNHLNIELLVGPPSPLGCFKLQDLRIQSCSYGSIWYHARSHGTIEMGVVYNQAAETIYQHLFLYPQ